MIFVQLCVPHVVSRMCFVPLTYFPSAKTRRARSQNQDCQEQKGISGRMVLPRYHIRRNLQRHEVREHCVTTLRPAPYLALA